MWKLKGWRGLEMKAYVYARVSTRDQNLEVQLAEIKKYTDFRGFDVLGVFTDKASGKDTNREGYKEMIKALEVNPLGVKAIVVHKLDRIGRNIRDLINIADFLEKNGIGLISITNNIDTTTKEGRLFFYMLASLAEYERELIMERTALGYEAAVLKGVKMGQPSKNVPIDEVKRLLALGVPKSEIARRFKIHRTTLYKKLAQSTTDNKEEAK